ncbi:MAG: YdcF family protein [Kiritimatiellae bacterium]|nr:YdcF family protein [Kiritimatiellia bacterium]
MDERHGTKRGCGCALVCAALAVVLLWVAARRWLYPFLARSAPAASDALVVEGWLGDVPLAEALSWADAHGIARIYATGGPFETGSLLLAWTNCAAMTAARLEAMGATQRVVAVAAPRTRKERTAAAAEALRAACGAELRDGFTLASQGTHTRRSWRVYRRAFGPETAAPGSLALAPPDHGADDWWTSSAGVRTVLGELIAYAYDLCCRPSAADGETPGP